MLLKSKGGPADPFLGFNDAWWQHIPKTGKTMQNIFFYCNVARSATADSHPSVWKRSSASGLLVSNDAVWQRLICSKLKQRFMRRTEFKSSIHETARLYNCHSTTKPLSPNALRCQTLAPSGPSKNSKFFLRRICKKYQKVGIVLQTFK